MDKHDYRIMVQLRRRGEMVFHSFQLKTEQFNDIEQVLLDIMSRVQLQLEEDIDYLEERGNDDA